MNVHHDGNNYQDNIIFALSLIYYTNILWKYITNCLYFNQASGPVFLRVARWSSEGDLEPVFWVRSTVGAVMVVRSWARHIFWLNTSLFNQGPCDDSDVTLTFKTQT